MKTKSSRLAFALGVASVFFGAIRADAETILLPQSRDQQYRTFGLYIDEQSSLLMRNGGRASAGIGGAIALLEETSWRYRPQLILHGSANANFRLNDRHDTLLTETDDARVGLSVDAEITESTRAALGWTHQSGHISDDVVDKDLIGTNLGNEIVALRLIHDIERTWRVGATARAYVGTEPGLKGLGGDQFAEWFPCGVPQDHHRAAPFLAASLEEYGRNKVELTFHAQAGYFVGNHFDPEKQSSARLVTGYYNGNDPRLKYYQFKASRAQFGYLGLMFDF